jgi:hypothetical protein
MKLHGKTNCGSPLLKSAAFFVVSVAIVYGTGSMTNVAVAWNGQDPGSQSFGFYGEPRDVAGGRDAAPIYREPESWRGSDRYEGRRQNRYEDDRWRTYRETGNPWALPPEDSGPPPERSDRNRPWSDFPPETGAGYRTEGSDRDGRYAAPADRGYYRDEGRFDRYPDRPDGAYYDDRQYGRYPDRSDRGYYDDRQYGRYPDRSDRGHYDDRQYGRYPDRSDRGYYDDRQYGRYPDRSDRGYYDDRRYGRYPEESVGGGYNPYGSYGAGPGYGGYPPYSGWPSWGAPGWGVPGADPFSPYGSGWYGGGGFGGPFGLWPLGVW